MNKLAVAIAGLLVVSSSAWAQTCETPTRLFAGETITGNTCDGENTLPNYGGTDSPQAELVYYFDNEDASGDFVFAHTGTAFGGGMFLMPSPCSNATDPISFGNSDNPMPANNLAAGGTPLVNGTRYFVIVTADPGGPADACGPFSLTAPDPLPVELQSFSVD